MLINESKLIPTDKIQIKGFQTYRKDRQNKNRGGGILILIRNNIPHEEITINTTLEAHAIKIPNNILIISCYVPPKTKIDTTEMKNMLNLNTKVIIAGDMNAKHQTWHCKTSNVNGRILYKFINNTQVTLKHPENFTLFPTNSTHSSIVDLTIVKNTSTSPTQQSLNELDSDHNPVLFQIINSKVPLNTQEFLNYKKANWPKFRKFLTKNIKINSKFNTTIDIENSVSNLTQNIQEAIRNAIPKTKLNTHKENLPENIMNKIKIRNSLNRKYKRYRNINYKIEKNYLTFLIKKEINIHRNNKLENKLKALNVKDHTLWKAIKISKNKDNNIPTLHGQNGLATSDKNKSEAIADVFEQVHHLTRDLSDLQTIRLVNRSYNQVLTQDINKSTIKLVSNEELTDIIKKLKPKKAPGLDGIQNIILKNLNKKAKVQLIYILNACLKLSYFPSQWKKAKVLPFKKPGKDHGFPQNYRPISLLPTMGKVLEIIINKRLNKFITNNNILIPEQFGFRKKHGTVQQLARLTDHISSQFNKNKSTGLLLLDIEKAFDTVWVKGIIHKLNELNIPLYITKFIISYLTNRKFTVSVKNETSKFRNIAAGVPQGSILGPILFLAYINDIPKHDKTNLAMFADDTAIYASSGSKEISASHLQKHISILETFYTKWKIKINVNKTELLFLTHKNKKLKNTIKMYNENLNTTNKAKYLGLILDTKLNFTQHINSICKKVNAAISILYPLMNKKSQVSSHNKFIMYKVCIRPIIMYAAPIWSNTNSSNYNNLQRLQNKCLRLILKADRYTKIKDLHNTLNIPYIKDFIKTETIRFYNNKLNELPILNNVCERTSLTSWDKYKIPQQICLPK